MEILLLTYLNRSGSTLLSKLLSSNNNILACPEAEILVKEILEKQDLVNINKQFLSKINYDSKFKHWNLELKKEVFNACKSNIEIFIAILNEYRRKYKPDASIILYKALEILGVYPILNNHQKEYSNIKILSLLRDPRAIFHSQRTSFSELTSSTLNSNPLIIAYQWNRYVSHCKTYSISQNFQTLKYEDLVSDTNSVLQSLMQELGYRNFYFFSSSQGDMSSRIPKNQRSLHKRIDSEPDETRIDEWEKHLNHYEIKLIEAIVSEKMLEFGYTPLKPQVNKSWLFILRVYYKLLIFSGISRYY